MTASPPSELELASQALADTPDADAPGGVPGLPSICPFLAGGDGSWRSVEPTRSHVCAAVQPPAVLASAKQRMLCLGAGHAECATFKAAQVLLQGRVPDVFDADLWPHSSPRVVTFEPVRTGLSGGITTPRARAGGQLLLVGLIVVAFMVLVLSRATSPSGSASGGASPVPTVVAGAGAGASPAVVATAAPSPAVPSPPSSAEPGPSDSAGPSEPAGTTYKVKRGDTLSGIALKFGVTVKALRTANGLAKGAVLRRGQVLAIPGPEATTAP